MKAVILIDNISENEMRSEWGLAIHIDYNGQTILLDAGTTGAFVENAEAMGIDLAGVKYGVLSHAHYDHADGFAAFFERNTQAKVYLRSCCQENCYDVKDKEGKKLISAESGGPEETPVKYIGIKKGYLRKFEGRFVYVDKDYELLPGAVLVPHKTEGLEKIGEKAGMYVYRDGAWRPDCYDHEQSLVLETGKGLVIFNSCCHGGADHIITEVGNTFPGKRIYALIGGFHLFKSSDEDILKLAERIRETGIERIYTGHCTGEHAMELLKQELGDRAVQIHTGMEIDI